MSNRTLASSLHLAITRCVQGEEVGAGAVRRIEPTLDRASEFFTNREIEILADVRPVDAGEFVMSRLDSGLPASVAVLHNRRSALRLLFRIARRLGLVDGDPTLDLKLPPKSSLPSRPLDDDEIELCRDVAEWTSARVAVAWALAEATARGAEIAAVTLEDIDLEAGRVSIVRSSRTLPRVGTLSNWGAVVLRRCVDDAAPGPLAYAGDGRGIAGQVSTCRAIGSVLLRSGLSAESDVRPMSVAAWAGRGVLERTGSIEAAALAMGVRSLDRAARLVGHDWSAL